MEDDERGGASTHYGGGVGTSEPPERTWRNVVSPEAARRAREAFQAALAGAALPYEVGQIDLVEDADEKFIQREVERKLLDPGLPNGGNRERRVIERLEKLKDERDWGGSFRAEKAMGAWRAVLPDNPRHSGRYYVRNKLSRKENKDEYDFIVMMRDSAASAHQWDKHWFWKMLLEGLPEPISNFEMKCVFLLRKPDGSVDRLVRLQNIRGEVSRGQHHGGCDILDPDAFASPEKFRKWCLARGNFSFAGNQTHLQKLHEDNANSNAWRVINQVNAVGWHAIKPPEGLSKKEREARRASRPEEYLFMEEGIWFCDDCAYADGQCLRPDDDGIYWWDGQGYYLNRKGREAYFSQGRPKMQPDTKITELDLGFGQNEQNGKNEKTTLKNYFREVCQKFYDTMGGYEGLLVMGSMFAYTAAPEIFAWRREFPGAFIHGQMGSGKTVLTEWAMRLRGYDITAGIGLLKGTAVGLMQQCENYSNEPLWADEFRQNEIEHKFKDKEAIIRDSFNRLQTEKWTPDGVQREMRTALIVSGESTSSDAALRSRFPHVQVSKTGRLENHYDWMQAQKKNFFVFGRLLLERRAEFVTRMRRLLDEWMNSGQMSGVIERVQLVHGVPWAAWQAVAEMIEAFDSDFEGKFLRSMIDHAKKSGVDVSSETNINIFWDDLLTAWKAGELLSCCFHVETELFDYPPDHPEQFECAGGRRGWQKHRLYIDPDATLSAMQIFLRKQGSQITLKRKDLRDQLSKSPYWIPGKHTKSVGDKGKKVPTKCWAFDLDYHPLGRQDVSKQEYEKMLEDLRNGDPRLGPLHALTIWWIELTKGTL